MTVTHEVLNQPPPLAGHDVAQDPALLEALDREGGAAVVPELHELGQLAATEATQERARLANECPPRLLTHDRFGHRIDEVEFHPAWHELMSVAVSHGVHAAPWSGSQPAGSVAAAGAAGAAAHLARAAKFYVWGQAEAGHMCPISMTYAALPALAHQPELAARFGPLLASCVYDPGLRVPTSKAGLLAGMAMTEKQGGSDVRAGTTRAVPAPGLGDGVHLLTGHKWFNSAPMCDLFLVLAQAPGGLTCFLLPRVLPDGSRNAVRLQRLKDKLGNRSNASAEVEYDEAFAWQVGEAGRGVRTIIDMVSATRLDCVVGGASGMRRAVVAAVHHCDWRQTFGRKLVDHPLMATVLADLAIESEAATTLAIRLAGAAQRAIDGDAEQAALLRVALPAAKYWVCKRAVVHAGEALECYGGNGFVEESGMPRLYREAPLNSIWEGSGNVTSLDVLRAMAREPASVQALFGEIELAAGADRRLDAAVAALKDALADTATIEPRARRVAEQIALALQGSLLVRYGKPAIADAFCASRLGGDWGHAFGTLPAGLELAPIIERARPQAV